MLNELRCLYWSVESNHYGMWDEAHSLNQHFKHVNRFLGHRHMKSHCPHTQHAAVLFLFRRVRYILHFQTWRPYAERNMSEAATQTCLSFCYTLKNRKPTTLTATNRSEKGQKDPNDNFHPFLVSLADWRWFSRDAGRHKRCSNVAL